VASGTSTGGNSSTTLNDTTQTWGTNQWAGLTVQITGGTGIGQYRKITSNTATQLTVSQAWTTIPDATSTYAIQPIPLPDSNQGGGDGIIRTGFTYDANSLQSAVIDDQGNVTVYLYDDLNRRVAETQGLTVNSTYTKANILGPRDILTPTAATINNPGTIPAAEIDAQLAESKSRIDAVMSLFPPLADRVDDHPPTTITWGYAPDDNVLIVQDENNSETFTRYDAIDRPIAVRIFRAGHADSFAGDPVFAPNPVSIPTHHSLDDESVPTTVDGTSKQDFQYDGLSRLVQATDNNDPTTSVDDSVVTDAYDSLSRLIEETQAMGGNAPKVIDSAWRADSLRSSLTYPNGRVEVYTYDNLDRLRTVGDRLVQSTSTGGNTPTTLKDTTQSFAPNAFAGLTVRVTAGTGAGQERTILSNTPTQLTVTAAWTVTPDSTSLYQVVSGVAGYDYIGVDRVLQRRYPQNGTRETYLNDAGNLDVGYDGLRRPVQLRDLRTNNTLIIGFTYTYDRMNNKLTEGKLHDSANSEAYSYDSAYRLVKFVRPNAGAIAPLQSNWTLDGVGNWKQVDGETRQHSSFNEIVSRNGTAILSDDNGNETDDGTYTYTYDAMNRLRTVTRKSDSALIAVYAYDALGRRIQNAVTNSGSLNGTTNFYLDGQQEIEERNGANALTQQYVYGIYLDEPLVLDRAALPRLFYNQNTLYSVYALTDTAGNLVEGYQYDAYGRQTTFQAPGLVAVTNFTALSVVTQGGASRFANPTMFTGRRLDPETGLYYYRARHYDPAEGRFLQRDPLGSISGLNLYRYAWDRPTAFRDPTGTTCTDSLCGPDITSHLSNLKAAVWGRFKLAPWWLKLSACVWDVLAEVQELYSLGSIRGRQGACPTHDCFGTVWMFGSCVMGYEANYFIFGVIARLCEVTNLDFENPGPYISILLYKALRGTFEKDYAAPWTAEMWRVYRNSMWALSAGYQKAFPSANITAPYPQAKCRYCEKYKGTLHWYWMGIQSQDQMYLPYRGVSATSPYV
jgi:RHS repeat-associated protein